MLPSSELVFWAFAAIVLIVILVITVSNRGIVRIVGSVVLAGMLAFGLMQRLGQTPQPDPQGQRGKPTSPAAAVASIPLESIKVDELKLSGGGAPFELRGRITNTSADTEVHSITLRVARRDCYEGALDPTGCVVMWQDQHWIRVTVPPQGERAFASSFYARTGTPRLRGTLKDEFALLAATGDTVKP